MKSNWSKAIALNLIFLILVILCTDMSYETNDDSAIASRILAGDPYVEFVDYWLCKTLCLLQPLIPGVNVYVLMQIVLSFIAFTLLSKVFFDGERGFVINFLFALTVGLFAFDHYAMIQFTKTSALLLLAGGIILVDGLIRKRPVPWLIVGMLLFYCGSMVRFRNMPIAVAFAGLFLFFWILENRKDLRGEGYLKKAYILRFVIVLVFIAGTAAVFVHSEQSNRSTEALREYQSYNSERSYFVDYSAYEDRQQYADKWKALGLSENDLYLINNWYFDYDGAASEENLKAINEAYADSVAAEGKSVSGTIKSCLRDLKKKILSHSVTGMQLVLLFLLALTGILILRPKYWIYILALGGAVFAYYLLLYYLGRPAYRALYVSNLAASLWMLYYYIPERFRSSLAADGKGGKGRGVLWGLILVLFAAGAAGTAVVKWNWAEDNHAAALSQLQSEEMAKAIEKDTDHAYIFAARQRKRPETYAHPLLPPEPEANVFTFGSWGTKSPYLQKKMAVYGLNNTFSDLIDNPEVYVLEDKNRKRMEEYLNKWYPAGEKKIRYRQAGQLEGHTLWQIVTAAE